MTENELEKMRQHSVVGYRILSLFDNTLDLAEYVYNHHERWDGNGYPRGLKGEQIPLIKEGAGTQFDPMITELFIQMMNRKIKQEA